MFSASGSIIRVNIRGDSGHPCLVQLEIWNGNERVSAENSRAEGAEYKAIMALWICPCILNLFNTDEMHPQCTLPNAFSASRDRKIEGVFVDSTW